MVEKKHATGITRRDVGALMRDGAKIAVLTLAASSTMPDAEAQPKDFKPHNLFDALKHYEFIGQDGNVVNIDALKTSLKDDFVTVSFGFERCKDFCPMVNAGIAVAGRSAQNAGKKMTSVFISVEPERDGITPQARKAFMDKLKQDYKIPQNCVILYPSVNGRITSASAQNAAKLSTGEFGLAMNMASPVLHSAMVTLYSPGGTCIAAKNGMTSPNQFDVAWGPILRTPLRGAAK